MRQSKRRKHDVYSGQPQHASIVGNVVIISDSDGDPDILPHDEEEVVDEDGDVNYMTAADNDTVKHWYEQVATYLVHEGTWYKPGRRLFRLAEFPAGYKLYTHYKGKKTDPRTDSYLYGSSIGRHFRSPEEFTLHAKWLAFGRPMDSNNSTCCECRYCSGRSQGAISSMLKRQTDFLRTTDAGRKTGKGARRTGGRRGNDHPIIFKDYTGLNRGKDIAEGKETPSGQSG
ncbi:hypothetical protein M0805_001698 [Coniferiporia weirii]|nr:hypothetical protein M0805_001698 [Coniferiporia weirii]